jgi:ribosome biogenesis GTPase
MAQAACQFSNCLHREEPDCAVRGDWERYEHYRIFLEEAIARQEAQERTRNTEATTKQKSRQDGQTEIEPKLERKKYRQPSRRIEKQRLKNWDADGADIDVD